MNYFLLFAANVLVNVICYSLWCHYILEEQATRLANYELRVNSRIDKIEQKFLIHLVDKQNERP